MGPRGNAIRCCGAASQRRMDVRQSTIVASSMMFIALGVAFVVLQGSSALSGLYARLGAADLSLSLETTIGELLRGHPLVARAAVALVYAILVVIVVRRVRRPALP